MVNSKRDRLEIIYDILLIIKENNNIKPTPLLRKSNLSPQRFEDYKEDLIDRGFIEESVDKKNKKIFVITKKGYEYLENYKVIIKFIKDFDL